MQIKNTCSEIYQEMYASKILTNRKIYYPSKNRCSEIYQKMYISKFSENFK